MPPTVESSRFPEVDRVAEQEIALGHIPGAVIVVGHRGRIVYRKAFGNRSFHPEVEPMSLDTLFDIASLTKVIGTATAVIQLASEGRIDLDDPVGRFWPGFSANGKGSVTIRQLLTHTSGLPVGVDPKARWSSTEEVLSVIEAGHPIGPPGGAFQYSDVNFIVLGEVVRRVSGLPLDDYCSRRIFQPLGMRDTSFRPSPRERFRIAPSDVQQGMLRRGDVQDPTAYRMGGVAGHAGVFSSADDLALFAQMLVDGGVSRGRPFLSPEALATMTHPHIVPGNPVLRGLGWDMQSPYSREHNAAFPAGSYGHTGYTGSSIWVDPSSTTFLIILTNRLHPYGKGQVNPLRAGVAAAVAAALHLGPAVGASVSGQPTLDSSPGSHGQSDEAHRVHPGIETLASTDFAPLIGRNIGLITNQTAIDGSGRSTVRLLLQAHGVHLRALFSPEHGLAGNLDRRIGSGKDSPTGLPVYSLYGDVKRPTPDMLRGLDTLVYDIQDVGVRYYTYITTMAYAMEAAAAAGLEFIVLDRPDPITASTVEGPVMDPDLKSFVGYFPLPVRYGMTPGELAQLFNRENHMGVRLQVVPMRGYRRETWFDQTGLVWTDPSPNIRSLTQAILYSGVGIVESANVSVGRGTPTPFEVVGAPWITGELLARQLTRRNIAGIRFESTVFTPRSGRFRDQRCEGIRMTLSDRDTFDGPALGVELAAALYHLYPQKFEIDPILGMLGSRKVLQAIKSGEDPHLVRQGWQTALDEFRHTRQKHLLY